MNEIYKRIGNYVFIKKNEKFGLTDITGDLLLPCEYDSIFYESGGFVIIKNSKCGYIKFSEEIPPHDEYETVAGFPQKTAESFLPCSYDRIEPTRNGLVLYSMTDDEFSSGKREWYDYKTRKVYKGLHFLQNYGDFDKFIDSENPDQNAKLKIAGEDRYIELPHGTVGHILYEIPLYNGGAHYFVCCEELSDEEAERTGHICEYFFLIVLPHSYTFTEPKPKMISIFEDFPKAVSFWDSEAEKEREHEKQKKKRKKA